MKNVRKMFAYPDPDADQLDPIFVNNDPGYIYMYSAENLSDIYFALRQRPVARTVVRVNTKSGQN